MQTCQNLEHPPPCFLAVLLLLHVRGANLLFLSHNITQMETASFHNCVLRHFKNIAYVLHQSVMGTRLVSHGSALTDSSVWFKGGTATAQLQKLSLGWKRDVRLTKSRLQQIQVALAGRQTPPSVFTCAKLLQSH